MSATTIRRVGVLGVEEGTSHIAGQWAPPMNPLPGETRRTGMVMTHVWDKERRIAEQFAKRYGVPTVVDRPEQMLGQVDAVVQSGYRASYWSVELVKPFLENGAVAFVDRPGAYSVARAKELLAAARRGKGIVYWGNNHEGHINTETAAWRAQALGPIQGIIADSLADPERRFYSMHCLHGVYMLCTVLLHPPLGIRVMRVRTFSTDEDVFSPVTVVECHNADKSPFLVTLQRQGVDGVRHDGERPVPRPRESSAHRGWLKIFGREGMIEEALQKPLSYKREYDATGRLGPAPGQFWQAGQQGETKPPLHYASTFTLPAMLKLDRMMETRQAAQTDEQLLAKLRIFLASWKSLLDGGSPVTVDELPDTWTGPNPYPGYLDGYFQRANMDLEGGGSRWTA